MAIYDKNDNITYAGCVIGEKSHMWMDGMEDVFAIVWDDTERVIKYIKTGYYGADGQNLMQMEHEVDVTPETARKVLKHFKAEAVKACADSIMESRMRIEANTTAEVIRGRKVKKGTKVSVFWVGEKPTYRGRQYDWMKETEAIAGCYDENGNKIWIKAEYLKRLDLPKMPNAKERHKFIKSYVERKARELTWIDLLKLARAA